ncbi:alpha/beta fold hydrolase [Xanthomonas campestris]|uniref:alpha/beta fold hydrolase n=1 Tax=Xanthomonas campestris TaxID=339 RepID=UPI00096C1D67|nr:alpha/beta fold hydrolase [Xanthomonas campestris]MCF8827617.1 alpha/beta fold hydrolase [Xanthomonas campestris pv. raphani]MEA9841699.1 alpha/beta fold hydrolase [Xanthomonas campestris pv. raphani]MEA9933599.1 alpha/beta fold hydrolase [Xanthomonas campestris pv. raphani]QLC70935.1 alpha/beta fold hydrolase [Xanthomonas campestris pv. raphani]WDJ19030.1 alpha/beta fold hydrolase [Xanthomonas campestris pv. raphani]
MRPSRPPLRLRLLRTALATASRLAPGPTGRYLAKRFVTPLPATRRHAAAALANLPDTARHTLRIADTDVTVYCWGDPAEHPYVLLSHGWSSFGLRFAAWVPRLQALGYAVVAFDQAGHGASSGRLSNFPHFVEVLRRIGRHFGRPAAFIGHSMGASSVVFADEASWRPTRYVLIAPLLTPAKSAERQFAAAGIAARTFAPFEQWLSELTGKRFADFDASERLPQFDRPALIIHDRRDRETPWEEGARFAALWPGAQLVSTEGLGHNRMVDHASVIDQALHFVGPASR